MENNGSLQQPLLCKQLKDIAYVISENTVISPDEIEYVKTNEAVLCQVLKLMPVMLIKREKPAYVNIHEFVYTPRALQKHFCFQQIQRKDVIIDSEIPNPDQKESDANTGELEISTQDSLLYIASKFPPLVDSAADFVNQHSFAAQIHRQTNTGSSAGVSIAEIRHLLDKVPGLKQEPNRRNMASQKCKALICKHILELANSF